MEIVNEIERAELLHKELCAGGLWPARGPARAQINSELLLVLAQLHANCSKDFLVPGEMLVLLQQLLADAQFRADSRCPLINPSALWQEYAMLKKHFLADAFLAAGQWP
jgi:hypothetical protein